MEAPLQDAPGTKAVGGTLPWFELALLVIAIVVAVAFQLTLPSRLARDSDYAAVQEVLAKEAKPGDVVLLFPWWTERARLFLPAELPVVGYLHSERDDLLDHPRIWVLGEPDLPFSGQNGFMAAFGKGRSALGPARNFGKLTLTLYQNGRYRPSFFSALDALSRASVYLEEPDGRRESCAFDGRAFSCPRNLRVAAEWHELFYQPRRCITLHPPGGPTRLVLELPALPAGQLLLEGGITWEQAARLDNVTPLTIGLQSTRDGNMLGGLRINPGEEGMKRLWVTQPAGGLSGVKVWTQSDNPEARDACVDLRVLGGQANPS